MPLSTKNKELLQKVMNESNSIRKINSAAIVKAKNVVSPIEVQVAFLKSLVENKEEAEKFIQNPKEYSLKHRVILDPNVVGIVTKAVVFKDVSVDISKWPEEAVNEMLAPGSIAAWPVAVAAGAAVVAAAAAVVTMVVTLVRANRPQDMRVLTELSAQKIKQVTLPGGRVMSIKTAIR